MFMIALLISALVHAPMAGAPVITSHPADYVAYIGADVTATFTVGVTASSPAYQWQTSGNDGASWSNLVEGSAYSGTATATLTVAVASTPDGSLFRCVVTDASGSVTSGAARLTITHGPTQSALDSPHGTISGPTPGAGWAFRCGGTITHYALLVDGAVVPATFTTGVSRPDVQAYYAAHGCASVGAQVGFTFTLDAVGIYPGSHQVKVRVTDDRGLLTDTNVQTVTVVPAPGSPVWTQAGTLPAGTSVQAAVAVGGAIYAATANAQVLSCNQVVTLQAYDPGSASWGPAILPPSPVMADRAKLAVLDDVVYLVGPNPGCAGGIGPFQAYDISSGTWSTYAPLPSIGILQGLAAIDGLVYVVGQDNAAVYDPASNAWSAIAAPPPFLNTPFQFRAVDGSVQAMDGLLYLVGGIVANSPADFTVEKRVAVYDPQQDTWTEKAPMRVARHSPALSVLGGKLYAAGGTLYSGGFTETAEVEAYDPMLDQWMTAPVMAARRTRAGAATVDGVLYVLGGTYTTPGQTHIVTSIDALSVPVDPRMNIDEPTAGATVGSTFTVRGWALDLAAVTGPGVDDVHVWAYPLSGGGTPSFLGHHYFGSRPDVGAVFGSQFTNSGFSVPASGLPAGPYRIVVSVWSARAGRFIQSQSVDVTVALPASNPVMSLDTPLDGAVVSQPFMAGGWAADLGAPSGNGVDAVHVWAFPVAGGQPVFVAASYEFGERADVGAAFGSQFTMSGFTVMVSSLPPGVYDLAVYAHSAVANTFNQARVVRITVQ